MTKESMREALEMALDVKEKMQHWGLDEIELFKHVLWSHKQPTINIPQIITTHTGYELLSPHIQAGLITNSDEPN